MSDVAAGPGTCIGFQFELQEPLGEGGMGRVFLATDCALDRLVAVKLLRADASASADAIARFRREARLLSRLTHPNIVAVHAHGIHAGDPPVPYIVLEYVHGRTLADRLAQGGPVERVEFLDLFRQLAGALTHAHAQGVAHRDLKPANVLLTRAAGHAEFVKVVDFGLARLFAAAEGQGEDTALLTRDLRPMGTPRYMAPEQVRGLPADDRSDQYSLAVMACELLTGEAPFEGTSAADLQVAHLSRPPRLPRILRPDLGLSAACDGVFDRALAKQPEHRWPSVSSFVGALSDALGGTASATVSAGEIAVRAPGAVLVVRLMVSGTTSEVADVLDEASGRLAHAVRDGGGQTVGALAGRLHAVFPGSEDDAEQAVGAGLAALRSLAALAESVPRTLSFAAGVAAGEIVHLHRTRARAGGLGRGTGDRPG